MPHTSKSEREHWDAAVEQLSVRTPQELLDDPDVVDELTPEQIKAFEMMAEVERREKDLAAKTAALNQKERDLREHLSQTTCQPVIIGSRDTHPDDAFDLIAGHTPADLIRALQALYPEPDQPFFADRAIVLIPAQLWPSAVQPKERPFIMKGREPLRDRETGAPLRNLVIGQSQIRESYMVAEILVDGTPTRVSVQAYASLSVNPFGGPGDIHRRLDRAAARAEFQSQGADEHWDPVDDGQKTFIPSLATDPKTPMPAEEPPLPRASQRAVVRKKALTQPEGGGVPTDLREQLSKFANEQAVRKASLAPEDPF